MDLFLQTKFHNACDRVIHNTKIEDGIGTLSEKTIHAVLKHYLCPDISCHEVKVHNFYADILLDSSIIEIQTRNFNTLRRKLDVFLPEFPVTIVYPIPYQKWLRWIDEETGEVSLPRKSPKRGTPYMVFPELYRIKSYLVHENFRLRIVLMDVEEYRYLNGWSKDRKKGSERCDGIPVELIEEITIEDVKDFSKLIPEGLPEEFTVKDYKKATGLSQNAAGTAVHVLNYVGRIKQIGKLGKAFLYTKTPDESM